MPSNIKSSKSIGLVLVTISLLPTSVAWAQRGSAPARTKTGGTTSDNGMTAVEPSTQGSGRVEQQIKTLHEQGRQAALKGDASFMEKYLNDDYVGIAAD